MKRISANSWHKSSSTFFSNLASPTLKGSQLLLYFSASVSHILRQSTGRDKVFGLFQAIADLYKNCMLDYLRLYRIREWPVSVQNAHSLQIAIKGGRKFFRLFRWMEEMCQVELKLKPNMKTAAILKLIRHTIGIIYYFLDNIIWTISIGLLREFGEGNSRLEGAKDTLSLIRYVMRIVIFLFTTHKNVMKEKSLRSDLMINSNKEIALNSYGHALTCRIMKARSKRRFQAIEMMINIFRIIMLFKSLRLPGSQRISSVFYSVCAVISIALSLFKVLTHKSSPVITYNIKII